ncbi:GMC family oxidoreductase [Myxococcota bacterium]|nr:GMC family oxidoreductase [Myxococcota bacterium]
MSHWAFRPSGEDLELSADYVVVGSGAGGSAAAVTLARAGAEVAIVEAGAWRDPEHYPSSVYGAMRDLFDDWSATVALGRSMWPVVQGTGVGGTTVINSAICVRTPGDVFLRWRREHGVGGDELAERVWRAQDRIEEELGAEEVPPLALGRSSSLAVLGSDRAGLHGHVMRRYVKGCKGTGQCLQGCREGRKQSTNLNYIPETMRRGGSVISCAPVKKVLFEGRRAIGVTGWFVHPATKARGAKFTIRARKSVIIAASATHSPALLLRSGVKSKALGEYFRAHPGTGLFGVYDEPVDMNVGATQGWASTHFRDDPGLKLETLSIPPEMVASRLSGGGRELMERITELRHLAMWVLAVRAETAGSVRNGPGDRPFVRYSLDRADMLRLRHGTVLIAKAHFAAGARSVIPGIFGLPYKIGPDEVHLLENGPLDPRKYLAILSHLFGGCVMGTDPARSVVDVHGRVHGYEGLVVADASVIPTNLGVNPQHTIMGLATIFAEDLAAATARAA